MTVVVDTNVILVANRQHREVSEACVVSCAKRLQNVMANGRIAIDDGYRILKEYQRKTTPHAEKRPGDAFVKWLLRNNANPSRCDQVTIVHHSERGFDSFPDDTRLVNFDPADRMFVAVAATHTKRPQIFQAADSKWLGWAPALRDHGVVVAFVCPGDMQLFHDSKSLKGNR